MNGLSLALGIDMARGYVKPAHPSEHVNAAGKAVRRFLSEEIPTLTPEVRSAVDVIGNFRAAHLFPLNTFYMTLKNRSLRVTPAAIPSMRLKRFESIARKLIKQESMKLTQMQDIGGCRVVLPAMEDVYAVRDLYVKSAPLVHELAGKEFEKDYIVEPKASGYRSVHLKYKFNGREKSADYDGLRVEMQLRTALQHQWATAVEAAETFTRTPLKASEGAPNWLRFFALMGTVFAMREGSPVVPGTPESEDEVRSEIRALNNSHYI